MNFLDQQNYHHFHAHPHDQMTGRMASYGGDQQALHEYAAMMATQQSAMMTMPNSGPKSNETKPRLGKSEVETLEAEFNKNPKPTTNTKRQFAEQMNVDLARINNWFQNRRAKRKQEKKQQAYEKSQDAAGDSVEEPATTTAEYFTGQYGPGYFATSLPLATPPVTGNGPPPPSASYNPNYPDPSIASRESLKRTMAAAAASQQQTAQQPFEDFDNFHGFEGDSAPFPPSSSISHFSNDHEFSFTSGFPNTDYTSNMSTAEIHNSPEQPSASFPSELMSHHSLNGLPSLQTENPESQELQQCASIDSLAPFTVSDHDYLPAPSHFLKSPPPSDLASRRKKAKPSALIPDTLTTATRPPVGARTLSYADGFRRPSDSPASPMRRVMSAGGGRSTISGRINKSGAESAQRSPININGFSDAEGFMKHNYHTISNPPSLTVGSALNSSLAPPTPMSPRDMRGDLLKRDGGSPSEGLGSLFDSGAFSSIEGGQPNFASTPPETPQPRLLLHALTDAAWATGFDFDVQDQPLFTPGGDRFTNETQMPFPAFLNVSQPQTPAFNQQFNLPYHYPESDAAQYMNGDFNFQDPNQQYSNGMSASMSPTTKQQKTFQFNNSTAADFNEK